MNNLGSAKLASSVARQAEQRAARQAGHHAARDKHDQRGKLGSAGTRVKPTTD